MLSPLFYRFGALGTLSARLMSTIPYRKGVSQALKSAGQARAGLMALLLLGALSACATPRSPNYNKPLDQSVMSQINTGMSERDVRQILGSPAIADAFRPKLLVYLFVDKSSQPWQAIIGLDDSGRVQTIDHNRTQTPSAP